MFLAVAIDLFRNKTLNPYSLDPYTKLSFLLPGYTYQLASLTTSVALTILGAPAYALISFAANIITPMIWYDVAYGTRPPIKVLPDIKLINHTDLETRQKIIHLLV